MVIATVQEMQSVEMVLTALEKAAKKATAHESVAPLTIDFSKWPHLHKTAYWARAYLVVAYHNVRKPKEIVIEVEVPEAWFQSLFPNQGIDASTKEAGNCKWLMFIHPPGRLVLKARKEP